MADKPKLLTSKRHRDMARLTRDEQWEFMRKVARHGTVWFCPWDKYRKHTNPAADEDIHCLIGGMERLEWIGKHLDWWTVGEWDEERCARPIQLTEAGKLSLENWRQYDMEPVTGGLVEPPTNPPMARETFSQMNAKGCAEYDS